MMSDIIGFLERAGSDAAMRHASRHALLRAMRAEKIVPELLLDAGETTYCSNQVVPPPKLYCVNQVVRPPKMYCVNQVVRPPKMYCINQVVRPPKKSPSKRADKRIALSARH
jgi:hypothetical protein